MSWKVAELPDVLLWIVIWIILREKAAVQLSQIEMSQIDIIRYQLVGIL